MDASITRIRFDLLLLHTMHVSHRQFFPIYLSTLTIFLNVSICPIYRPLVIYKFFGSVNEVVSQNKSRQSDLDPEKFWVTQCGWIMLCTTVDIVMAITNWWEIFRFGVNRYHYEKLIGTRELLKRLALYCFNHTFSTDTGTPSKNIPPLDEFNKVDTVFTCRALHFSSSIYTFTESSTISYITLNSAS